MSQSSSTSKQSDEVKIGYPLRYFPLPFSLGLLVACGAMSLIDLGRAKIDMTTASQVAEAKMMSQSPNTQVSPSDSTSVASKTSRLALERTEPIALGAYDPTNHFQDENILIEQVFVPWRKDDTSELVAALTQIKGKNRLPMLSLEPWPWNWNGMTSETLFQDVVAGRYDESLIAIFQTIQANSPEPLLFRWGHEMEIVDQYPWSKADAEGYIQAYRHVVDLARQQGVDNIEWVWSPAGNRESQAYWPGENYVDYVGFSLYAHPQWNNRNLGELPPFKQLMEEKYPFVSHYGKPVIIAEFGVEAEEPEKTQWLIEAVELAHYYPLLTAMVYFNQRQPGIVPTGIGLPQWSLEEKQVAAMMLTWNENQQATP